MRRETAYKLAGRHHAQPVAGAGLDKSREIRFSRMPPGQAASAMQSLHSLDGVLVVAGERELSLTVRYSLLDCSLEMIENTLRAEGFHLDNSVFARLLRALVYFCEETQRHNLSSPERLIKKSNEVYIKAYDQHPHGDHDDTPPELREYK